MFGPLLTPRSPRRTAIVLTIAVALFAAFLIARLLSSDQSNGLLGLQMIPITLVALELGLLPALAFAAAALGSVAIWAVAEDIHISAGEYAARAAVYFPIAIAVGWITSRLRVAEQTVDARERRLRTIVESSTDALITSDADGRILAWNTAAERMYGWRADEAIGRPLPDLVMPEALRNTYWAGLRAFLERGEHEMVGRRFEGIGIRRYGGEFPVEVAISAVRESDSWIFHAFVHDITERKATEDERKRLVSIVESTGDAILSFTLDGRITSWNPGAEQVYGYTEDEALEMSLFDFVPPDQPDDVGPVLGQVRSGGRIDSAEFDRIGKGGRHVEVSVTVTPITNAAGKVVAGAAIHRDISERKRRERYLTAQHGATQLLAHVPDLDDVGPEILPVIGGAGSWLCAAYWARDGEVLRCASTWTTPTTRLAVRDRKSVV